MSKSEQSLFIVVYDGRETADDIYEILHRLKKEGKITFKTAATVVRTGGTKLKVNHKRRLTAGKGLTAGGILGLVLAGTGVGLLVGAFAGGLIGARGRKQRQDLQKFLVDKMGPDDSVLAILVEQADWQAVHDALVNYEGEEILVELTDATAKQLADLAAEAEVQAQVADIIEFSDDSTKN